MGSVNTRSVRLEALQPGDHIFIWDRSHWPFSYQHHGIVWAAGDKLEDVRVCHVWTPLEGFQQAQSDSYFRVTSLDQFLYHRDANDLRLVEYNELSGKSSDRSEADPLAIVMARCTYLLGRGRGDYNPITQNCEHAARWCKTGEQWCTQTLTPGHGRVPFEDRQLLEDIATFNQQIELLQMISRTTATETRHVKLIGKADLGARTLFWLDSFSIEMADVRRAMARNVFKGPPLTANFHPLRFKSPIWSSSVKNAFKKPHLHLDFHRHVDFAASFLTAPHSAPKRTLLAT